MAGSTATALSEMTKEQAAFLNVNESALITGTIVVVTPQMVHQSEKPYTINNQTHYGNMLTVTVWKATDIQKAGAQPICTKEISFNQFRKLFFGKNIVDDIIAMLTDRGMRANIKANVSNIVSDIKPSWFFKETKNGKGNYGIDKPFVCEILPKCNYKQPILVNSGVKDDDGNDLWDYKYQDDIIIPEIVNTVEINGLEMTPVFEQWIKVAEAKVHPAHKVAA